MEWLNSLPGRLITVFFAIVAILAMSWASVSPLGPLPNAIHLFQTQNPLAAQCLEDFLLALVFGAIVAFRSPEQLVAFKWKEWLTLIGYSLTAGLFAPLFWSAGTRSVDPLWATLALRLDVVFTVIVSAIILKERVQASFWVWVALAIVAGIGLTPNAFNSFRDLEIQSLSVGSLYLVAALSVSAFSLVLARKLIQNHSLGPLLFWRHAFGLLGTAVFLNLADTPLRLSTFLIDWTTLFNMRYLSELFLSGFLGPVLLLLALNRSSAPFLSLSQLFRPAAVLLLSAGFLGAKLDSMHLIWLGILVFALLACAIQRADSETGR